MSESSPRPSDTGAMCGVASGLMPTTDIQCQIILQSWTA